MKLKSNQEEAIEGLTIEYPYVLHLENGTHFRAPWHWHEEVEFDYIVNGEIEVITTNQRYVFGRNQAFFMNPNVLCCMNQTPQSEKVTMYCHIFHPVFLGGHFKSVFYSKYMNPVLQNKSMDILEIKGTNEIQRRILKKLYQVSMLQKEEDTEFLTRNYFSEIWMLLLKEMENQPQANHTINLRDQDRMQSMLSYIHQNYADKINLEEISGAASISSRECLRCFRNTIQKSPIEYLMDYRLDMAKKLLRDTDMPITEIGLETGFSSNAYFGKVFREKCEMTPKEYRNSANAHGKEQNR